MDFFSDVNGFANLVGNNDGQFQASMHPYELYAMSLENGNAVIDAIETDFQAFLKKR